jgi:hypothetical protein
MHNPRPTRHSGKLIKQGWRLGIVGSNMGALFAEYTNKLTKETKDIRGRGYLLILEVR